MIEESNQHYQQTKDNKSYKLTISSTQIADIGQYTIRLSDKSGDSAATVALNVYTEGDA